MNSSLRQWFSYFNLSLSTVDNKKKTREHNIIKKYNSFRNIICYFYENVITNVLKKYNAFEFILVKNQYLLL